MSKNVFYHQGGRIWDADNPNANTPIEPVGWYFWDETQFYYHGPYETEAIAEAELDLYARNL